MTQLTLIESKWCDANAATVLISMRGREFTADDLHGLVTEPMNPNLYGALMSKLRKHLEYVRHVPSTRPEANRRKVSLWRVKV